jgi:hypothetical protein
MQKEKPALKTGLFFRHSKRSSGRLFSSMGTCAADTWDMLYSGGVHLEQRPKILPRRRYKRRVGFAFVNQAGSVFPSSGEP